MRNISHKEVKQLLLEAGISTAAPELGIGRELTYRQYPPRIVVVHLSKDEPAEYLMSLIARIFELDDEWLLFTRYGLVSDLELPIRTPDTGAIAFTRAETPRLAQYLSERPSGAGLVSADLYVLGRKGHALVTWDHHSADEGIDIKLQTVADASKLLVSLNELGVELEMYYSDG
jgi:hypothetical protein